MTFNRKRTNFIIFSGKTVYKAITTVVQPYTILYTQNNIKVQYASYHCTQCTVYYTPTRWKIYNKIMSWLIYLKRELHCMWETTSQNLHCMWETTLQKLNCLSKTAMHKLHCMWETTMQNLHCNEDENSSVGYTQLTDLLNVDVSDWEQRLRQLAQFEWLGALGQFGRLEQLGKFSRLEQLGQSSRLGFLGQFGRYKSKLDSIWIERFL